MILCSTLPLVTADGEVRCTRKDQTETVLRQPTPAVPNVACDIAQLVSNTTFVDPQQSGLEVAGELADIHRMDTLASYRKQALKLAEIEKLGDDEGYAARIPGFRGLLGTGRTKKETLADLESALAGWIELALKRGIGLPAVVKREVETVTAA